MFLWRTVGVGRADITEWQSLFVRPSGFILWALGAVVVAVGWHRRSAFRALRFIPPVVLGFLAIKVGRLDGFFVLAAVVMVGPLWAGLGPARFPLFRRPASGDLRRETEYSERVEDEPSRFYDGLNPAYPDEIGADYIWLPNQLPEVKLLPGHGWVPIFKGPRSIIFAGASGESYTGAPVSGPRCFPGP